MTGPQFTPPTGTSRVYDYTWADGKPAFKVCRRDANGAAKKTFKQFSLDGATWVAKQTLARGTQPLYHLPVLLTHPAAPVLLVEGEKAADAAERYLPTGWLVTTWAGGSGNLKGPDLSPLDGRKVVIWPDNDEAGRACGAGLQERVPGALVVTVPVLFPEKWDLADQLPDGFDAAWVTEKIIRTADNKASRTAVNNLPRKLNGHDHAAAQQKPILLVDSDTSASAALQYLPTGWSCTVYDPTVNTSLGPATHAVIWGRNDEGGHTWAEAVADALPIPSHVVTLANLPAHWHLADTLPVGRTGKQLTGYLAKAIARCQQRARAVAPPPAAPPAPPAPPPPFTDLPFIRGGPRGDGAIKPIMKNATMLLTANRATWPLRFNEFSHRTCLGDDAITDQDILTISQWVQEFGVHASVATITDAINAAAVDHRFHPVREYLDPLKWDGVERLDMLFVDHAGTPDTPLTRAVTSCWFKQAVARIYRPGCQADGTLILEGTQGLRKSSFFRELFGDRWFTDHLPDIASKDALLQLRGVWCVEIGELATLGRAESAKVKQFLTSQVDRYRDPYGRVVADFPRTCVFSGSVNPGAGGYLKDETGARRFWPVSVNEKINTGAVAAIRDQLWAEALTRFKAGERWFLESDDLTLAASDVVGERFTTDPWQERIDEFLRGRTETTIADIFKVGLNIPDLGKWSQLDMNRIARCLAFSNWIRVRRGTGASRRWSYIPGPNADVTPLPFNRREDEFE